MLVQHQPVVALVIKLMASAESNLLLRISNSLVSNEPIKVIKLEALDRDSLLGDDHLLVVDNVWVSLIVPENFIASLNIEKALLFTLFEVPNDNAVVSGVDLKYNGNDIGIASDPNILYPNAIIVNGIIEVLFNVLLLIFAVLDIPNVLLVPEYAVVIVQLESGGNVVAANVLYIIIHRSCVDQKVVLVVRLKIEEVLFYPWCSTAELILVENALVGLPSHIWRRCRRTDT